MFCVDNNPQSLSIAYYNSQCINNANSSKSREDQKNYNFFDDYDYAR